MASRMQGAIEARSERTLWCVSEETQMATPQAAARTPPRRRGVDGEPDARRHRGPERAHLVVRERGNADGNAAGGRQNAARWLQSCPRAGRRLTDLASSSRGRP